MREHVLQEDISYGRTCLTGHVLQDDMSHKRTCLQDISYGKKYLTEGLVLQEGMTGYVLQEVFEI